MIEWLKFLVENKGVVIGAVAAAGEIIVIVVNTIKQCRAPKEVTTIAYKSKTKTILWVLNPINIFRKAK